jgi:hypothetical protein
LDVVNAQSSLLMLMLLRLEFAPPNAHRSAAVSRTLTKQAIMKPRTERLLSLTLPFKLLMISS